VVRSAGHGLLGWVLLLLSFPDAARRAGAFQTVYSVDVVKVDRLVRRPLRSPVGSDAVDDAPPP
jgi:hypothetical protein